MFSRQIFGHLKAGNSSNSLKPSFARLLSISSQNGALTNEEQHHPKKIRFRRQHPWNRSLAEAEALVGFPTSLLSLRTLMNDDATQMASHLRKLMNTDHPIVKTMKRLVYYEKNNLQVHGLLILLLCRGLNKNYPSSNQHHFDMDSDTGILMRQRRLAEFVEMIYSAQSIHNSVMNLPLDFHAMPTSEEKRDLEGLEQGNKIAILGGDYLLAKACVGLADLRNTYVVELISSAIADFTQANFFGVRDVQGRMVPTEDQLTVQIWEQRNSLACGSLMGNGCQSAAMLAGLPKDVQTQLFQIGVELALALQGFAELQPFLEGTSGVNNEDGLDLASLPVLTHLKTDPELLAHLTKCRGDVDNVDFTKVFKAVHESGVGISTTQETIRKYVNSVESKLENLIPDDSEGGDAKIALLKLTGCLGRFE